MGAIPLESIEAKILIRFGPEGWNRIEHGPQCIPDDKREALPMPKKAVVAKPLFGNSTTRVNVFAMRQEQTSNSYLKRRGHNEKRK